MDTRSPCDIMCHMTPIYVLLGSILAVTLFQAFRQIFSKKNINSADIQNLASTKAQLEQITAKNGEISQQLASEKSEKDEIKGKATELKESYIHLKSENGALIKDKETLQKTINKYEAELERKEKDQERKINELESARNSLAQERARVIKEDEDRLKKESEERDRMWAEHEIKVVSHLTDLCNQPQFAFSSYDNNNLPEGFHGSLKPDFMIDFLDQYVVFDAKVSEAKNLQIYINDQVKKTAAKVKGNKKIYTSIFLVVPTVAIGELKKKYFYEEGFTFFVVEPESIASILALFKKIENYEFAEAMDPQERENIVDLVAAFNYHISARNAHELGLILHGLETLDRAEKNMDPKLLAEAMAKKTKMRHLNLNTADTKELVANPEKVTQQLLNLVEPKAKISKEDLQK